MSTLTNSALGTVQYSTATPASHAALLAEVTALRASLSDAVELVESLRADRDGAANAHRADSKELAQRCESLRSERDALRAASDDALEAIVCLAQRRVLSASKTLYGCDCFRCRAADKLRAALERSAP